MRPCRDSDANLVRRIVCNAFHLLLRSAFCAGAALVVVGLLVRALGVVDYGVSVSVLCLTAVFLRVDGACRDLVCRFLGQTMGNASGCPDATVWRALLVFSAIVACVLFALGECVGGWILGTRLSIPPERITAAWFVFHGGMTIVALKMLQTPFASLLVMNEQMASFSLIGFAEAVFSLGGAWMLRFVPSSRLEFYVVCLVLSASFVFALHVICCWRILPVGRVLSWRSQLPALTRFFSFRILSAFSNAIKIDGVALLVNAFAGVAVSAGWASAVHVRLAFQVVVDSFQQSCSPTLYKRVAAGDSAGTRRFLRWEELVSLLLICTPFVFWFACSERLIPIWFGDGSPVGLEGLVAGSALLAIIDAASGPLTVTILATGRIARFQMAILLFAGMSFGGAWLALSHGGDAIFAMSAVAAANLLSLVYRLVHIRTAGILREKKE